MTSEKVAFLETILAQFFKNCAPHL